MHSSRTWGLTVNEELNLDSFHRQQLRIAPHIKFPHAISKSDHYQRTHEILLTLTVLKNRGKLFGHILPIHPQTPAQRKSKYRTFPMLSWPMILSY